MSDNVFDILLRSRRRRGKKNTSRLKSLISSSDDTEGEKDEKPSKGGSPFDLLNQDLGEEKDQEDYMEGLEKLSMRELDEKPEREQLRLLKLGYNKTYDHALRLSNIINERDREVRDLQLDNDTLKKRVVGFRNAYRDLVDTLPGNARLKELINSGNWIREEVAPLLEEAINKLIERYNNADEQISDNTKEYMDIIKAKDEEIAKLNSIVSQAADIEKMIKALMKDKKTESDIPVVSIQDKIDDMEYEESAEGKLDLDLKNSDDTEDESLEDDFEKNLEDELAAEFEEHLGDEEIAEERYEPHFSDILSDQEDKDDSKDDDRKEKKNKVKEEKYKKPGKIKDFGGRNEKEHPLSPNYKEVEKQEVSDIFDENLSSYLNNLSNEQEYIIKIIGETGISRNTDLRDYLSEDKEGFEMFKKGSRINYQQLSSEVASLRGLNILEDERLSLGGRGGGANQIVYELSDIGKQAYKSLYDENPVVPERKRIVDLHGSLEHGYMIKDSAFIFRELGYEVLTETKDLTYKLDNGRKKIFDLVVIDKDDKDKKMLIEVERGTHNKEDFYDAMDRIYEITDEFYFIAPSNEILQKETNRLFFLWIRDNLGGIKNADLTIHTTTMPTLSRKPKNIWNTRDLRTYSKK